MKLNIDLDNLGGALKRNPESLREIVDESGAKITYITFAGARVTKSVKSFSICHAFFGGWFTRYLLEDGEVVDCFDVGEPFDWRHYKNRDLNITVGCGERWDCNFSKMKNSYCGFYEGVIDNPLPKPKQDAKVIFREPNG